MKLKNLYVNSIMNWMTHHGTLKFTPEHINSVLIATWKSFKLSSTEITQTVFKKTNILILSPSYIDTYHQDFLAGIKKSNREKEDGIVQIEKAIIAPIYMEEVRTTDPMVILREKGRCRESRNFIIRASTYETVRTQTVLPLHQIKTVQRVNEYTEDGTYQK